MTLLETIQSNFSNLQDGQIIEVNNKSALNSWVIKINGANGVAIEVDKSIEVNEKFSKMNFFTKDYSIGDKGIRLLAITSDINHLRNEFAKICRDFIELGPNNETRKMLTTEPLKWWMHMKELLGNANHNKLVYSIIAEMISFTYLYDQSTDSEWYGPFGGSIDLISKTGYYEVKSTVNRYKSIVQISGQYQLFSDKPQYLLFCRLEKSENGLSINHLSELLIKRGIKQEYIEERLIVLGVEKGSTSRKESYRLLEFSMYKVDEKFPRITPENFKNNQIPKHIEQIFYSIDLTGLDKKSIDLKL
ncbi:PD-(D/E)XK motif protein [Cytobacillus gottheilii]|uniref:PD-(D/E)XK motif protein n=1 Tax=Cytobacillus gottheilii TaxID=859144 RepID=UPI0009BBD2D9|nr:PD-(D/E)XK motif protein [Cytobacillus gottheilii]